MKIDYDEVLSILTTFQDAETPFLTLQDLGMAEAEGGEKDKKVFHLMLLADNGSIVNGDMQSETPKYIGFFFHSLGVGFRNTPIMLTQQGHDLANALRKKPILERIKKEFTDAPFDLIKEVTKSMLTRFVKERIGID
ncbi:DUF2513 domain-containing protein [Shigella sonnei]|nr:DUF2513 domain-containing protein [Shigella sonnei]EGD8459640.1 DUF2513 domain-containing protein [Shigella sonnei]EGE2600477.1 DUF2513 domain-containing protein [Shigella sonnei]EGE4266370.1 DUF2513 domain-containing protein [Shigella sonnei]